MIKPYVFPLLSVLIGLNNKYQMLYCFPSLTKIQQLLIDFHGVKKSTRTLIRWFGVLEKAGYVERVRRTSHDPELGMVFRSTLSKVKQKGYKAMKNFGVPVWTILKKISRKLKYPGGREDIPDRIPVPVSDQVHKKEMRAVWDKKKAQIVKT
ncbi:hypothetical protein LCGC14_0811710 [marine sediment metagenome]|uniref:Uncharacterized protein n=1 Tax=marine sediment metagenome TaxID=412755 RepID=A0A0F9STW2_9ZZZZ